MTDQLEKEISKEVIKASARDLAFMKKDNENHINGVGVTLPSTRQSILNQATQIATNDRQALYGDQTELNQFVAKIHALMVEYRSDRMKDGEFTQWIANAFDFARVFKSPVYNSETYTSFAAGVGIAAECASKEDK